MNLMEDGACEAAHAELASCTELEFLTRFWNWPTTIWSSADWTTSPGQQQPVGAMVLFGTIKSAEALSSVGDAVQSKMKIIVFQSTPCGDSVIIPRFSSAVNPSGAFSIGAAKKSAEALFSVCELCSTRPFIWKHNTYR